MPSGLKEELLDKISSTNDEDLLMLLKEDFDFFSADNKTDVTDTLSTTDRAELINIVSEPFGSDTISQSELDEAIRQWHIK